MTNISDGNINITRLSNPGLLYLMEVRGQDGPAEKTDTLLRAEQPPRKDSPMDDPGGSEFNGVLKPGESWAQDSVVVTQYYTMAKPGKYTIMFSQGTNPGQPNNVVVKSNTITITVVAPEPTADTTQ